MKKIILVSMMLLLSVCCNAGAKKREAQKFAVTFTISYNALTLAEAAKKEIAIKESFDDACDIDVKVDKESMLLTTGTGAIVWTTDNLATQ